MNRKIIDFIKKNKYILLILLITTLFFIVQHVFVFSWDFIAYVLNAKHLFDNGVYFETFRPPLTSFLIGLFAQISGYATAEIIYIILVNISFCIGVVLLSKTLNFNKELFYLLLLTPMVLFYGLLNGTELLSLTFLIFGIYFILKNNWIAGLFLGLSALTRYAGIVFGVLLLFHRGVGNKIKSILLFLITFCPWLIYNRIKFGNFFTSIADQYFQNITSRVGLEQAPQLIHFIYNQSILFLLMIVGLCFVGYAIIKYKSKINKLINLRISIIMFIILLYTIYSYFSIPFKDARYLFVIALPLAYFTYFGLVWFLSLFRCNKKIIEFTNIFSFKKLYWLLIILLIISSLCILYINYTSDKHLKERYVSAVEFITDVNLNDCLIYSDNWIYFSYIDENILLLPIEIYFNDLSIYNHKIMILYLYQYPLENQLLLESTFPVIYKNRYFLVLGDRSDCNEKSDYSEKFYDIFKFGVISNQGIQPYSEPCAVLFNKYKFMNLCCNYLNYNIFNNK